MKTMKRMMIVMLVLAFALGSVFTMASCAKKVGKVEEQMKPAPTQPPSAGPAPTAPAAPMAPSAAPPTRPVEEATALRSAIQAFESTHIYFDFDKSDVKPEAKPVLEKKADFLRANPQYKVSIEGYCDERGTNEYNMALGDRRAKAAMKYLNALGISAGRMSTISYGEERPADPGHNETAWAKNRRAEFKLSK
jgi:peptidoglycan-associated lipoprotein